MPLWNKEDITLLATDLGGTDAYGNYIVTLEQAAKYYDLAVDDICRTEASPFAKAAIVRCLSTVSTYDLPEDCRYIHAVFYSGIHLSPVSTSDLDALTLYWRVEPYLQHDSPPVAWTREGSESLKIRIFPVPTVNGAVVEEPIDWGEGFPDGNLTILYSDARTEKVPETFALYLAYRILRYEFSRVSDHQDLEFSSACTEFTDMLEVLLGMHRRPGKE